MAKKRKSMIKRIDESVKTDKNIEVTNGYTPIKINNLKDARRLLSRLIYQLQTGEVESKLAKDICYLLISYVNIFKAFEFEERLAELETKMGTTNGYS
jgi:hypothetical protein